MSTAGALFVPAVALAGVVGALLPSGRPGVLARLDAAPGRPRGSRLVTVLGGSVVMLALAGPLPSLLVVLAGALAWTQHRRLAARRRVERRRELLGELLSGLVAELRSGAEPRPALLAAASGLAGLEPLVASARPAGDVAAQLDDLGREPGGTTAGELAVAWRVAETTGCGLAAPVARVLRSHLESERLRRQVAAELAGPTATARLLALLPLAGVGLGTALGAQPLGFLLGTSAGRIVLMTGLALNGIGLAWARRLTSAAEVGR